MHFHISQSLPVFFLFALFSGSTDASPPLPPHSHTRSARNRTCTVSALGSSQDDSPALLAAIESCNNNGTVLLHDPLYTISTALNISSLSSVDFSINGTITFTPNITYWTSSAFQYAFQNTSTLIVWSGQDVNWYGEGSGVIDGAGQAWWDAFAANASLQRPVLWTIDGVIGGSMTGLEMINPPNWFNFLVNVQDFVVSDMSLSAISTSSTAVKNSDGWDTYRSSHITIQDSTIHNTDDCVSFKGNSTQILVQNLSCTGSHGISVGSLGQYPGVIDLVEDIVVYNNTLANASDGARIKVWSGLIPGSAYGTGGGSGTVRNVTYDGMTILSDDYAIELNTCYSQNNATLCELYPSNFIMEDITFSNFVGVASSKYDPIVGTLKCSSEENCINISAENISVTTPTGNPATWTCTNVDDSLLDINCST